MSNAERLVGEVLKRGGVLRLSDGGVDLSADKPLDESLVAELRENKDAVIAYLSGGKGKPPASQSAPSEWISGVSILSGMDAPKGWPKDKWAATVKGVEGFLSAWGGTAHALGWSELDCFGVNKWAPRGHLGSAGLALSMFVGDVALLLLDRAVIRRANGSKLTHHRRPPRSDVVPVWELGD